MVCHQSTSSVSKKLNVTMSHTRNRNAPRNGVRLHPSSHNDDSEEVDFFENPTLLSRLILNKKCLSASKRLRNFPNEASIWVSVRKRPSSKDHYLQRQDSWPSRDNITTRVRQLPLHMACNFLKTTDSPNKKKLDHFVAQLVATYPQACGRPDHQGRLPLHEAIWWNASPDTISTILMAYPEALEERDRSGFLPQEVLDHRRGGDNVEQIAKILQQGIEVWQQSRDEAMLRFKLGIRATKRLVVNATSALNSSPRRLGSKRRSSTPSNYSYSHGREESGPESQGRAESESALSGSWSELEQENNHLERLLIELYERNHKLGEVVNSLTKEKQQLRDNLENPDIVHQMEDANNDLRKKICRQEIALRDLGFDGSGNQFALQEHEEQGISMMSMDPEPPTVLTRYLETKIDELCEENDILALENERFQARVEELQAIGANSESSYNDPDDTLVSLSVDNLEKISLPEEKTRISDNETILTVTVAGLQKKLLEAQNENAEMRSAYHAGASLENIGAGHKSGKKAKKRGSLEHQLKEIDRRTGHDKDPLVEGHGSFTTPMTKGSVGTKEQITGRASLSSRAESRVSSTSWGLLSMAQSPRKSIKKKWSQPTPLETLPQGNDSKSSLGTFNTEAFHDSLKSFADGTDDLEQLYKSASTFYDGQKEIINKKSKFDGHKSAAAFGNFVPPQKPRKRKNRRFSDGGASPTVQARRKDTRNRPESRADPLVETSRLLAADEEIAAIIKEAEEEMGMELPRDLVAALRDASLHTASSTKQTSAHSSATFYTLHSVAESLIDYKIIEEAERVYGEPIPLQVVSSLRAASVTRMETSRREIEAMEHMKNRLEQELLDALIATAERKLHNPLPSEIVVALRDAASTFNSLLQEECEDGDVLHSIRLDIRRMDRLFKKAQKAHGSPFGKEIITALRRAAFVLQSRLEGTDLEAGQETELHENLNDDQTRHTESNGEYGRRSVSAVVTSNHKSLAERPQDISRAMSLGEAGRTQMAEATLARQDYEVETQSRAETMDGTTNGSLQIVTLYPSLEAISQSIKRGDEQVNISLATEADDDGSTSISLSTNSGVFSPERSHRRRRRSKTLEGGDDPGEMYRKARARSRSPTAGPTHGLGALYDRALRARSRSPLPEDFDSIDDDLDQLFTRASLCRSSDHRTSRSSSPAHAPFSEEVQTPSGGASHEGKAANVGKIKNYLQPPKRYTSPPPHESFSDEETEIPLKDSSSEVKKTMGSSEFDSIVEAAKKVLGHDISPELLGALRLISGSSTYQNGSRDTGTEEPTANEIDSDAENDENEDIRSTDLSKATEVSLDLFAVFQPQKTSELERKLNNLSGPKRGPSGSKPSEKAEQDDATNSNHRDCREKFEVKQGHGSTGTANDTTKNPRGRSPQRGVQKMKSSEMNLFVVASPTNEKNHLIRRTRSAEGRLKPTKSGESLVSLAASVGTDDLEMLYKQAVKQVEGSASLMASMPSKKGDAAFESIISDTEETYGIEIPSDVVEALKMATMGSSRDVTFISIVKSLHDDEVIGEAEDYLGKDIPGDLVGAIRLTSLPPGVSVGTLMPITDDGGSASILSVNKSSSRGSLSFRGEVFQGEASTSDDPSEKSGTDQSSSLSASVMSSHHGSFAAFQDTLDDAKIPQEGSEESGRRPPRIQNKPGTSEDKEPLDLSQHSDTSWGKLSLSKSPAVIGRKRGERKPGKQHKEIKDAIFERDKKRREKATDFMNSLADFGGPADDLRDLYEHAKMSLESNAAATAERKQSDSNAKVPSPLERKSSRGPSPLEPVMEGEASFGSIVSMEEEGSASIPRPKQHGTCIRVSPQELELDMLIDAAEEIMGASLAFDVDEALRKASRSMDESLDFIAAGGVQSDQRTFGAHLPQERLEITYQEAAIFLGHQIPDETFVALREAAGELLPNALSGHSGRPPIRHMSIESQSTMVSVEENLTTPTSKRNRNSAPTSTKSNHSIDTLFSLAHGGEDNLGALYKAAYAESPRQDPSSPPPARQQLPFAPPVFSSPNPKTSQPNKESRPEKLERKEKRDHPLTPPEDISPPVPTFAKRGGVPVSEVITSVGEDGMERTDSGRHFFELSPMTAASKGASRGHQFDFMDASKARLNALSKISDLDAAENQDEDEGIEVPSNSVRPKAETGVLESTDYVETNYELDAILSETQQEYGMELPLELLEALFTASAASLTDLESFGGSNGSSLMMQHIELEKDTSEEDSRIKGLVMEVRRKLSTSENSISRSIATRWTMEEYLKTLIHGAEQAFGHAISPHIIQALRSAVISKCAEENVSKLSWEEIEFILKLAGAQFGELISPKLVEAFKLASQESMNGQASGYFSAVSENEEISILVDDFCDFNNNVEDIMQEVKNVHGEVPNELAQKLRSGVDVNEESTELDYSVDFEYSQSTFSSFANSSNSPSRIPSACKRQAQGPTNDDSLSRIEEDMNQTEFDIFIAEATKEYGQPLPPELLGALQSISVSSGLTFAGDFEADPAQRSGEIYGVALPVDIAGALQRAARKSSKVLSHKASILSSLSSGGSLDDTGHSSSNLTVDDEADVTTVMGDLKKETGDTHPPPLPPPPPPPIGTPSSTPGTSSKVPVNTKLGINLMREVKKVYKKIPAELSHVLTRSSSLPYAMNTDEEIHIFIDECEEMSGKRLPADLVLALREASVTLRTPSNSTRSRRSRLTRQSSGSFRSTSRSSGMPSILEGTTGTGMESTEDSKGVVNVRVDRAPVFLGPISIPTEITTDESKAQPKLKSQRSIDQGVQIPVHSMIGPRSKSMLSSESMTMEYSASTGFGSSEHSLDILALQGPGAQKGHHSSMISPNTNNSSGFANTFEWSAGSLRAAPPSPGFNNSTATELLSNRKMSSTGWVGPPPAASDVEPAEEVNMHMDLSVLAQSASLDSTFTRSMSDHTDRSAESSSTEVTGNTTLSTRTGRSTIGTLDNMSAVSEASSLPSRTLPIGVNPTPPLPGVETDDLSIILKEAAKRMT
jgi:hypothetical protein